MRRALGAISIALSACGGAAPAANATTPASGAQAAPEMSPDRQGETVEVSGARADFDRAEESVAAAQGDCASACRALASMERAAEHLCALDSGAECRRAHERVDQARERIRATCGGCP